MCSTDGDADPGAEVLGIGGDRQHRLGRGLEQQVVDDRLVLIGDVGDLGRQREHDVEVRHRQQLGLARRQPLACRRALALRAVPVAAAVVGDERMAARVFSQRATWPPSAAVRQRSIALITLSWPRLTWPRVGLDAKRRRGRGRCPRPPELDGPWPAGYAGGSVSFFFGVSGVSRSSGLIDRARSCWSRRAYSAPSCPAWRVRAATRHNAHFYVIESQRLCCAGFAVSGRCEAFCARYAATSSALITQGAPRHSCRPLMIAALDHAQRRHRRSHHDLRRRFKRDLAPLGPFAVAIDGDAVVVAERAAPAPRSSHCRARSACRRD